MVMLLAAAHMAAQQRTPDVITSWSRLVQVDVVARDKNGATVSGLHKEDFEVLDNGVPQTVTFFSAVQAPSEQAVIHSSPGTYTNHIASTTGARGVYAVILLDWLNTALLDRQSARQYVVRMLSQLAPDQPVELLVLDSGLRVVHDLSGDPRTLARRLNIIGAAPNSPDAELSMYDASIPGRDLDLLPHEDTASTVIPSSLGATVRMNLYEQRIRMTLEALTLIADRLVRLPGRKSLIWVSSGFPLVLDARSVPGAGMEKRTFTREIQAAVQKLNAADTAVYSIDARGLPVAPNAYLTIDGLKELAERTGGRAWYNRNDIDAGMKSALADLHAGYTLGFQLTEGRLNGKDHRLRIRTTRPGLRLSYKESYSEDGPRAGKPPDELDDAMRSPANWLSLPMSVKPDRQGTTIELAVTFDVSRVDLEPHNGRWTAALEMIMHFSSRQRPLGGQVNVLDLNLLPETRERALRDGFTARTKLEIPAGATKVRVVLHDRASGRAGSVSIPLTTRDEQRP